MDYGLVICQANGRPIMTEHLNKRFKDILTAMNDPEIDVSDIVFHSIRHTSAGVKLRLSNGDLKAVQGDGGWSTPDMVTKRYAHILDEDRRSIASQMEERFYHNAGNIDPIEPKPVPEENKAPATPTLDANALASLLTSNPELLAQVLKSVQLANS
ncbi:MAG: tyrosine-type recombinase/integrase [Oscillospiraceae bacterium]|nr:tyrosine-type recombinase/integrase [Oscillospiraceae bacterium]